MDDSDDFKVAIRLLKNKTIDGISISFDYGLSLTALDCESIGFLPGGRNEWTANWPNGDFFAGLTYEYKAF